MKKIYLSTVIALWLLIALASTKFAAPIAGERQPLVKGSLKATETQLVTPPTMFVDATGSGNATQLGSFTMSFQGEVFLPTLFAASESATLVAADGSSIFGQGSGQGTLTGTPGIVSIVETYTITGGTGRFAEASGSFTVERLIDRATLASAGTIQGVIVLP